MNAADKHGDTALLVAAASSNIQLVHLLLKSGAVVNAASGNGQTPLWLAAAENDKEVVKVSF